MIYTKNLEIDEQYLEIRLRYIEIIPAEILRIDRNLVFKNITRQLTIARLNK